MDQPEVDECHVLIAHPAARHLGPARSHRRVHLGRRHIAVRRVHPAVLMLAGVLRREQNAPLTLEERGLDQRAQVLPGMPPEDALVAALGERPDRPERPGLLPAHRADDQGEGVGHAGLARERRREQLHVAIPADLVEQEHGRVAASRRRVLAARDRPPRPRRRHVERTLANVDGLRERRAAAHDPLGVVHDDLRAVQVERGAEDVLRGLPDEQAPQADAGASVGLALAAGHADPGQPVAEAPADARARLAEGVTLPRE